MGLLNLFRPGTNGHGQANPPGPSRGILAWLRDRATPWLGPRLSRGEPVDVEVRRQTVRSGPPVAALPWFLPYFDQGQTLGEHAVMRQAYRRMLADPNVKAAFLGKSLAVCALEIKVVPCIKKSRRDNEIADFVRWNLEAALEGGLPGMIWSILSGAMIDGYSVSEKVWEYVDRGEHAGRYCLRALKPKDTGADVVLLTDQYRNVTGVQGLRYNAGEIFPPSRFAIFRHLPLWDQPTGMSDLRAVYSRWWMLDTVLKLRAVGLEKRALPIVIGHYQSSQQRPSVEAALALVKSQNWLAVPEGVMIEALNIAGMADGAFAEAIRDLKHDIFLGIEGAVLQSLEGSVTDGRGDTSVHRSKADRIAWFVAQSIECLLNDRHYGVIPDLVGLNYAAGGCPRVRLQAVDLDEQLTNLEIDEKLAGMGLALSKDDLYERYGRRPPDPDDPDDALDAPKGGPALPGQAAPFPPGAPTEPEPEAEPEPEPEPVRFSDRFAEWDASKHPRGQPDNKGKFADADKGATAATAADPAANRPSKPEERHANEDGTPKRPSALPWFPPPAKQGKKGEGMKARPKGDASQTKIGDLGEELATRIGFRSILPEGQRSHKAGENEEKGSTIDLEYDHSGMAYELKLCNSTATEYRLKAKKEEKDGKLKFASIHGLTACTLVGVRDVDTGEVHFYAAKESGLIGAEVSEKTFDYIGTVKP